MKKIINTNRAKAKMKESGNGENNEIMAKEMTIKQ